MIRSLATLMFLLAGGAVLAGLACRIAAAGPPVGIWLAVFLAAFGTAKLLIAIDSLHAARHGDGGGSRDFASPFVFRVYLIGKVVVWAVAWSVAWYLIRHPTVLR